MGCGIAAQLSTATEGRQADEIGGKPHENINRSSDRNGPQLLLSNTGHHNSQAALPELAAQQRRPHRRLSDR